LIEFKIVGEKGAIFGPGRVHRYWLWRVWGPGKRYLVFIGLNPSTADENLNDPTVERMERRAREYGYDGLIVVNIFAFRATDPEDMKDSAEAGIDVVGEHNDLAILRAAWDCGGGMIVAGWGSHGGYLGRDEQVKDIFRKNGSLALLHAITVTKTGQPGHPLYLKYKLKPQPWITA
jgi:hypothetical protein